MTAHTQPTDAELDEMEALEKVLQDLDLERGLAEIEVAALCRVIELYPDLIRALRETRKGNQVVLERLLFIQGICDGAMEHGPIRSYQTISNHAEVAKSALLERGE